MRTASRCLRERSILVGMVLRPQTRAQAEHNLDELAQLSRTAGSLPLARLLQERSEPDVRDVCGPRKGGRDSRRL